MDMVKQTLLALTAAATLAASDFSIEIGSPAAATNPNGKKAQKIKPAAFSVRAKDCPEARFSGSALGESDSKQRIADLAFIPGSAPGSYAVATTSQGYGPWVAVITAECGATKLGALVPVSAEGVYDRAAAKFVAHAPTPMEMEEALRRMQGAAR